LGLLLALGLVACPQPITAPGTQVYLLTEAGQLVTVMSNNPAQATSTVSIAGLNAGDTLLTLDVRPQNSSVYGLARGATGSVQLYAISPISGVATPVGSSGSLVDGVGNAVLLPATAVDMDFNPSADRLRVVTSTGLNFRINPNTGALVDGDLGGAAGSVAGINPDGAINGGVTGVSATAYTNNQPNTNVTTQYTLDPLTAQLFIQNPPNSGTQTAALGLKLSGATPSIGAAVAGFDIPKGVDASASNTSVPSGEGFAALTVGGTQGLYRVSLSDGALTSLGAFGGIGAVRSLAVNTPTPGGFALNSAGTQLLRFSLDAPGTTSGATISGVSSGETLVGLDLRPTTRAVYALGVNATADTATLYLLDPQTGASTTVGATGQIAFSDGSGNPVDLPDPATVAYDVDFNPTVDRLRVITSSGLNFRVNPVTGAPVDGNLGGSSSVGGVNVDGALNGSSTSSSGTAYTNSFAGAAATTMYNLDATSDQLFIQNPPNVGTLTVPVPVTLGGAALNFSSSVGFDIPSAVQVIASNAVATGEGYAALSVAGTSGLYRINLSSGAATLVGSFASPVRSLAIHP
jgi:hypothetical protein